MEGSSLEPQNMTKVTTHNSTERVEIISQRLSGYYIFFICCYCVIVTVAFIGNGLVMFVTGYKMKMTVNSVWFLNLATADFFFSLAIISSIFDFFFAIFGTILYFMYMLNMFASIFFLTVISLDRCVCTWFIVWAQMNRTVVKARIICIIVWVLSICCSIPFVIYLYSMSLVKYMFTVGFLIPFLIIASSYISIGVRIKRLKRGKMHRSFRIIISVVLAFFICWFPFNVYHLCLASFKENNWRESENKLRYMKPFIYCLAYLNSCLNPILYVFMCDEYKKKLKQSLLLVLESAFAEDHMDLGIKRQTNESQISSSSTMHQHNETTI